MFCRVPCVLALGFSHVAGSIMSQQSLTILNLGAARFEY